MQIGRNEIQHTGETPQKRQRTWKDSIKMNLRETCCEMDGIGPCQHPSGFQCKRYCFHYDSHCRWKIEWFLYSFQYYYRVPQTGNTFQLTQHFDVKIYTKNIPAGLLWSVHLLYSTWQSYDHRHFVSSWCRIFLEKLAITSLPRNSDFKEDRSYLPCP